MLLFVLEIINQQTLPGYYMYKLGDIFNYTIYENMNLYIYRYAPNDSYYVINLYNKTPQYWYSVTDKILYNLHTDIFREIL